MSAPSAFAFKQAAPLGGGNAQHVAIAAKDDAVALGKFERIVDAADRQDANRAAGAMHIADIFRHQVVHAITKDGVRVPAAELHHIIVARRVRLVADRLR